MEGLLSTGPTPSKNVFIFTGFVIFKIDFIAWQLVNMWFHSSILQTIKTQIRLFLCIYYKLDLELL